MADETTVLWFRDDFRLTDHRALGAALRAGASIEPIYVHDPSAAGRWAPGAARRWWLHHSLKSLEHDLVDRGSRLTVAAGDTLRELRSFAKELGARQVYCSRSYEPWAIALEAKVFEGLKAGGIELKRYPGRLIAEPEALRTKSGDPFKVYTPFWRALSAAGGPPPPTPAPRRIASGGKAPPSKGIEALKLLPTKPDWSGGLSRAWQPGEAGAQRRLKEFLKAALKNYHQDRNRPDLPATSRLSPHLAHGELSPAQVWHAAEAAAAGNPEFSRGLEVFLKELAWREFSYHLLAQRPDLPEANFRPGFDRFPWVRDARALELWQRGATGYPIVDAGMRELWETGYMHNRVRMIVASFLVKDLLIDWREGEAWYWDTLVDADLANNAASWQWVAGSGADAAPYFRIFNPVTQGRDYDPEGNYVRRFVPELKLLPAKVIHAPWTASEAELAEHGVELGQTYPRPMVDHAQARQRALESFNRL